MKEGTNSYSSLLIKPDRGKSNSNSIEVPSIALPKGGGAIQGIDETFKVNPVNGTASMGIPLPVSEARGLSPALAISYSSGGGNSPFGLGWALGLTSIKRKTSQGIPQYLDDIDSDIFQFSGSEDLVPGFSKLFDGSFEKDAHGEYLLDERNSTDGLWRIRSYHPRIEGSFERIERWKAISSGEIRWRVMSRTNVTTLFGWTAMSRIADPANEDRIFEWLPEFVFDDKGNCAHYFYKKEDDAGFDSTLLHNRNRRQQGHLTYTNTYISQVLYGNKTPYLGVGENFPAANDYLFSTVFDYGEYNPDSPYNLMSEWDVRPDAYSDYKAGFEIRTTRLCKRVLLFHHFTEAGEYEGLVRSLNFGYDTNLEEDFTFLISMNAIGYIKRQDGSYSSKSLPPIEFSYQAHHWNRELQSMQAEDLVHASTGLGESYVWTDLYREGLAGMLTEQEDGWYYKHNLGNGEFEQAQLVRSKPSFTGLNSSLHLMDLDADGGRQLVSYAPEFPGYFELDDENEWQGFRAFQGIPNIDLRDQHTRLLDLNGNGRPDVVMTEDNVLRWYPSEGRKGFAHSRQEGMFVEEEKGLSLVFADQKQSIFLADMSGDGMTDIVRIRNGGVCYWPNLGYGRFGQKVAFDDAPVFDHTGAFDPGYIRLADLDGSGTTDIIYLGKKSFSCWKNLSGNRFSQTPFLIEAFPDIHTHSRVSVTDLLGNGLACIVWSSSLPKDAHAPLRYIDLMNSQKPHIMCSYKNNMGMEVSLEYTPSTRFYIEDKKAGRPWATKLHFPIHCVSRTTTEDRISGYRFVSKYSYHHGYYDHAEREFRGFGMVEQTDAETFEHWVKGTASNIVEEPLHQEPVVTKSWYHTGAFLGQERILAQFEQDYWYAEMERQGFAVAHQEVSLPDARLILAPGIDASVLDQLSTQEWQEAVRACKGMMLRTETFARDAVKYGHTEEARKRELTPYTVGSSNCIIELLQPKGRNQHAIFTVRESEAISYAYERNPEDPRITHDLMIKMDEYGLELESATVVYPRLIADPSLPLEVQQAQQKLVIMYEENQFTNDVIELDTYRLRLLSEEKTYELRGVEKTGVLYTPDDFENILSDSRSDTAAYHEIDKPLNPGKAQRRLIEHMRSTYMQDDLTSALPLHQLESLGIAFESYQLAYSPELVTELFGTKVDAALLTEGKFTHSEGDNQWWVRSGTSQFIQGTETVIDARNRFYSPISYTDPYGATTKVSYYSTHYLLIAEVEDDLGNKAGVEQFNFRTLSPQRMRDLNGNVSECIRDELGFVKALAVMGKGNEADELTGLSESTEATEVAEIQDYFQAASSTELVTRGKNLLQRASTRYVYDLHAYSNSGQAAVVSVITREEHYQNNVDSPVQISFDYTNGIGELVMSKAQAEPGMAKEVIVHPDNTITIQDIDTSSSTPPQLRWIGNGRIIKNNKGNPVKEYEPYFSLTHRYEEYKELVETGISPHLFYDAVGRIIKTESPQGTLTRVSFDAWKQTFYDANDTVLESSWYHRRINRLMDAELIADGKDPEKEEQAAQQTAAHAQTPSVTHYDSLGRMLLSVEHNKDVSTGGDEFLSTWAKRDSEGNLLEVVDARGNVAESYQYDMLGNNVYQTSMDSGQRWQLLNIMDHPLRTWDERNHEFQYFYDSLHRPSYSKVIGGDGPIALDHIFDRMIYGESLLLPDRSNEAALQARNILGESIQHYDTAGMIDTPDYNFKGQALSSTRRLFRKYKEVANWTMANMATDLESTAFTFSTETDALGRITRQIAPDGSIIQPGYNEGGLLTSETVHHPGDATPTLYIVDIDYNEKSQREKIVYGNQVMTRFYYDRETFQLNRLESKRQNNDLLQDWQYTYDPVGNITHVEDRNMPVVFFDNQKITSLSEYTYDALYRLVEATGRENDAPMTFDSKDNWNDMPYTQMMRPGDPMAMRNYVQQYQYDAVGNISQMNHQAVGNNWTRTYAYQTSNNRLISTQVGSQSYAYAHHAQHGFITEMPHLEDIGWNFLEQLTKAVRQRRTDGGTAETTWYQYDGSGERIRKVTDNQASPGVTPMKKEERIYLGGYEVYQKHSGTHAGLERISLSLIDEGHRYVMIERRNAIDDGTEQQLTRYQLHNYQGSAALELDSAAQLISYEEYHPYGTTAYQARNADIKSAAKRYRFTGMERDEESGLSYHSARYYLPWLSRWLSPDPIGIDDHINVYTYTRLNPIKFVDGSGLQADEAGPSRFSGFLGRIAHWARNKRVGRALRTVLEGHIVVSASELPTGQGEVVKRMDTRARVQAESNTKPNKAPISPRPNTPPPPTGYKGKTVKGKGKKKGAGETIYHHKPELPEGSDGKGAGKPPKKTGKGKKVMLRGPVVKNPNARGKPPKIDGGPPTTTSDSVKKSMVKKDPPKKDPPKKDASKKSPPKKATKTPGITPSVETGNGRKVKAKGRVMKTVRGLQLALEGDPVEAAKSLNPASNTTAALTSGDLSGWDVGKGILLDLYENNPYAMAKGAFDFLGPDGSLQYSEARKQEGIRKGWNPLCYLCHGKGGALDPNSADRRQLRYERAMESLGELAIDNRPMSREEEAQFMRDAMRATMR
ncbi:MAG: SpvB/TcaC N-terminal domain-containing protein [Bacteroidota bacterium]